MTDFWARRKAAVAEEAQTEAAEAMAAEAAQAEAELAERSDEEILAELELPEPETLDSPDALRAFMAEAIPQRLRTRALRHLWRLNPVLANLDGLVDYGEDFTDSATVMENLQTAYQVGKGMLAHVQEMAKADAPEDEAETAEEEADPLLSDGEPEDGSDPGAPDPQVAFAEAAPTEHTDAPPPLAEEELAAPVALRRMQFRFEEPA